jgi:pyruvate kinase
MGRYTKIVATLGPASSRADQIDALLHAGVDVFRLNLSHGELADHLDRLALVRERSAVAGRPVAVLADLPGPKIRAGEFPDGGEFLAEGVTLRLMPGQGPSNADLVTVEYDALLDDLHPGDRVVLGDGAIELTVVHVDDTCVHASVVTGGRVQGRPGVHLPSERMRVPCPTPEDLDLASKIRGAGVDYLAVSFVRSASDLDEVREVTGADGPLLMAKVETPSAVAALPAILEHADAVMVARGDLGISCPLEDVPHLQKAIVRTCVAAGVPVITATQMLESMITAPTPTRAEVSDVANAVFDGTDAVMLSAETAIGHDPPLVVRTMARIAERAEQQASYAQWANRLGREQRNAFPEGPDRITQAITHAAWQAAIDIDVDAIICCTRSGRTARAMARFRPLTKMLGLSPSERTVRAMALCWGIIPMSVGTYKDTDELVWCVVEATVAAGHVQEGDVIAVLAGAPDQHDGATDVLRIVRVD